MASLSLLPEHQVLFSMIGESLEHPVPGRRICRCPICFKKSEAQRLTYYNEPIGPKGFVLMVDPDGTWFCMFCQFKGVLDLSVN